MKFDLNPFLSLLFFCVGVSMIALWDNDTTFELNDGVDFYLVNVVIVLGVICLITSIAHGFYWYGHRGLRMYEYMVTAALMIMVIAILIGIRNIFFIICLSGLTASTMLFGRLEEIARFGHTENYMGQAHFMGYIPFILVWVILFLQYFMVMDAFLIPTFVSVIFVGEFLLFLLFAMVQFYFAIVLRLEQEEDIVKMNHAYNFLSLTSKLFLVFLTYFGSKNANRD